MVFISITIFFVSLLFTWGISTLLINIVNHFVSKDFVELVEILIAPISFILFGLIFISSMIIFAVKENANLKEECIKYGKKIDFKLEDVFYYDSTEPSARNIFCIIKDMKTNELYRVSNTSLNIKWVEFKGDKQIIAKINGESKQVNIGDTLTGWILTDTIKEEKISTKGLTYYKEAKTNFWGYILYNFNSKNDISILNKSYKICDGWYEFNL